MVWWKSLHINMGSGNFIKSLALDIIRYTTDKSIHGDDAWELVRSKPWPYGAVLKIPNRREGEYGYIGLMDAELRAGDYWKWLQQPEVLRKHFALNPSGIGLNDRSLYAISRGEVKVYTPNIKDIKITWKGETKPVYSRNYTLKEVNNYRFSPQPEIFENDADVIFFTMFKQYQEDFDWSELMGNERKTIKIKPLAFYAKSQVFPSFLDPPLYPGVGCPAVGFSPEFLKSAKECMVYIKKERTYMTVIINILDRWEVFSVGFFDSFDTQGEYSFPAMAIGGTSGVLPLTELCSYGGGTPTLEHGFRLDYTEKNWALSHGIPSCASTWWDGSENFLNNYMYSQVQAMLPDGNWQSFADFGVRQDAYYNYQRGQYFSAHKEPERISKSRYFITPNFTDLSGTTDLYPTGMASLLYAPDKEKAKNKAIYQLEPLYLVQRTEDNYNQNILGKVNDIYWCSQPVTRYGEYEMNGKTYLVIPNAWENRKFHIKNYFSALTGEKQTRERQIEEMERLEKLSRCMNCAIELGE